MATNPEFAALLRRLLAGEQLSAEDQARLDTLMRRKPGRPPRDDLKRFQDEFGRAAAYFAARVEELGDVAAAEQAADRASTSVRRIRGAVTWFRELTGRESAEWLDTFRNHEARARQFAEGGIDALSLEEILWAGILWAHNEQLEEKLPPDVRAKLFLQHVDALNSAFSTVADRTIATLRKLAANGYGAMEFEKIDMLAWVHAIASIEAEAQCKNWVNCCTRRRAGLPGSIRATLGLSGT